MVYNILSAVFFLLVVPALAGVGACRLFSIRKNLASCYLVGSFVEWAFIQLISVPLILARCSFIVVVILLSLFLGMMCAYGCFDLWSQRGKRSIRWPKEYSTWIAILLAIGIYVFLAVQLFRLMYISRDDSRYVVNAVDIVRTNRMFLTNPSTGEEIYAYGVEMHRDVTSPWGVYLAYTAKVTNIPVAVMAHTVLVQSLILCVACSYWLMADAFFPGNRFAVWSAVVIGLLVTLFGVRDGWDAEAFTVTTIWQGKGSIAAFGILTQFLSLIWIFRESTGWKKYCFLYCVDLGLCLMSGMGILISGIITGTFGIAYGILKKDWKVTLKIWIALLISLLYYGIFQLNY